VRNLNSVSTGVSFVMLVRRLVGFGTEPLAPF
jgi:hypothetical protein